MSSISHQQQCKWQISSCAFQLLGIQNFIIGYKWTPNLSHSIIVKTWECAIMIIYNLSMRWNFFSHSVLEVWSQHHAIFNIPGHSDQRPSLIEAHGLLFGSFLPNRSPWASIWCKYCYEVLERNCQIKGHGQAFRKPWYRTGDLLPNGQ